MEIKNVRINFLMLCDEAHFDESNKLHINGIFDLVKTSGFPALKDKMSLVLQLDLPKGRYIEYARIKKNDSEIARTPDLEIIKEEDSQHNIIHNVANLILPEPGDYEIEVFVNNNLAPSNDIYNKFSVVKE